MDTIWQGARDAFGDREGRLWQLSDESMGSTAARLSLYSGSTSRPISCEESVVDQLPSGRGSLQAPRNAVAGRDDGPLCWSTIGGLGLVHLGGLAGLVWIVARPSLTTLMVAAVFYALSGLAITAGYHRLFAHRTYRAAAPVRWCLLLIGAATFQNSALSWSADHRAHHADTDGDGDPHAITKGVWYAHVSWLFRRREASADVSRLTDLWAVRSIRLQHRWYPVLAIGTGLVVPTLLGALWGDPVGGLLVIGLLRGALLLQATFCVNSLAHLVGTRPFDGRSSARDSVVTALVTFGEGYHNFHHRFPYDYRNGSRWWQYDPSKWLIWVLSRFGLARAPRTAAPATVAAAVERTCFHRASTNPS